MTFEIGRRTFVAAVGATVALRSSPSLGQDRRRVRKLGFLMGLADDAESRARIDAFEHALHRQGWVLGQDIVIDYRFAAGDPGRIRTLATELIASNPDVLIGHSTPVVEQLIRGTRTIPIIFVVVADPVGSGFVASIPRPGGNATGFTNFSATITGKLLIMLKQIIPRVDQVALLYSPDASINAGLLFLRPLEAAAPSFAVKAISAQVREVPDIEARLAELAGHPSSGLIVMPDNFTTTHRLRIIELAAKFKIPTIYPYRFFADAGGLMSYGVDVADLFRRAPE